jgi:hypothetical protein
VLFVCEFVDIFGFSLSWSSVVLQCLSLQIVNFGLVIISFSFYWICFKFSVQTVYFASVIVSSLGVFMLI